jgi:hypothetical protein
VAARWIEARVGEHGELVLENLPFKPGQLVEVLVVSRIASSFDGPPTTLRDSVLDYRDPFEPVASEDWEAPR